MKQSPRLLTIRFRQRIPVRGMALAGILLAILSAPTLMAQDGAGSWTDGFSWGVHIITIPLTILIGVAIGWTLRERKAEQDAAMREIQRLNAEEKPQT